MVKERSQNLLEKGPKKAIQAQSGSIWSRRIGKRDVALLRRSWMKHLLLLLLSFKPKNKLLIHQEQKWI